MLWFPATAGLLLFAIALTWRFFRPSSPSLFAVIALTLFHVILLCDFYLLSWRLTPGALLALALIEGAAGVALLRWRSARWPAPPPWGELTRRIRWTHALFIAPLALPIAAQIAIGLWIGPRFSDAVEYHLINPMRWVQEGRLVWDGIGVCKEWFPLERAAGFPKTGAVTAFWHMVFARDTHPGALAQVTWALLGLAAIYALGREAGLQRGWAIAAAWNALFVPEALLQLNEAYVDLSLSSVIMAGALFLWRFWREGCRRWLLLAALAMALAAGIKSAGVLVCGVMGLAALGAMLRHRWPARRAAAGVAVIAGVWLTLAGPWFIYNQIVYRNPLYPQKLTLLGRTIGEGPFDKDVLFPNFMKRRTDSYPQAIWLMWREDEEGIGLAPMWSGLGAAFFILGLPGLLAALARAGLERHRPLLIISLLIALIFLVQPVKWHSRYTLYWAWWAGVAALWFAQRLSRPERWAAGALLASCLTWQVAKVIPAAASYYYPADFFYYALKTGDVSPLRLRCWPGEYTARHYIHENLNRSGVTIWISPSAPALLVMPRGIEPRLVTSDIGGYAGWRRALDDAGADFVYIERPRGMVMFDALLREIDTRPDEFELVMHYRPSAYYRAQVLSEPLVDQYLYRVARPAPAAEAEGAAP